MPYYDLTASRPDMHLEAHCDIREARPPTRQPANAAPFAAAAIAAAAAAIAAAVTAQLIVPE